MRIVSALLLTAAAFVAGGAVLAYLYLTSLACGYAPSASSCHALPWDLSPDDRFWLVGLPMAIVAGLTGLAWLARRRSRPGDGGSTAPDL
ncbi:hypothetical protein WG901_09130 [Novosphingobium sp. PS1R-30]|uniref:LPXTG cell wall anchor domain-containing protein n=1 Tax=Novosphingobium anseongense TaxID=3133436 RepID=A0ABU8RUM4_9SPHN|nr:MAG: hypothetical protein EOO76_13435 [Novosphingobium sp.]